jgi:hypothetical protein
LLPGTGQGSGFSHSSQSSKGYEIAEVFDRIEEPGSWVALYNAESDPEFREFLDFAFSTVQAGIEPYESGIFNLGSFIFISSAPSKTPFHIDRENNFFMQIRGEKRFSVFDRMDEDVISASAVEDFIVSQSQSGAIYTTDLEPKANVFHLSAGKGIYFSATSPHMAETTQGLSISVGMVFYSDKIRQHARVHQINKKLRRLGIKPSFPGVYPLRDKLKAPIGWSIAALKSNLNMYKPPFGSY